MERTKLIVGHASDLHGDYSPLLSAEKPDLWVCSGDMFGAETVKGQHEHFDYHLPTIKRGLRGAPVLVINGNHDRICWGDKLREHGIVAVNITEAPIEYMGLRWAGFREVPEINGMFVGEESAEGLTARYTRVLDQDFDVLVTHSPSHGIFSERAWGVHGMADAILSRARGPLLAHLCGHHHVTGGQTVTLRTTLFSNAARAVNLIKI